jgi:hypothetical protein
LLPFLKENFHILEKKINDLRINSNNIVHINRLLNYNLLSSIDALVEVDDDGFIARTHDLPLYGYGEEPFEAINNLKYEIESLYNDLMEDDNFTEDLLKIKSFLKGIVKNDIIGESRQKVIICSSMTGGYTLIFFAVCVFFGL